MPSVSRTVSHALLTFAGMNAETFDPRQFLELCQGRDEYHSVFVLGSYEHRVTITSQQVRACNLIYALLTRPRALADVATRLLQSPTLSRAIQQTRA